VRRAWSCPNRADPRGSSSEARRARWRRAGHVRGRRGAPDRPSRRASAAACGRPAAYPAMLVATLHRALSRRDLPSISPLASAIEVCREPPRQRGEVIQDGLGLHLPALEILQAGSVGDERYAGGGRGHAIHPGVADDDRRAVPEALANHAPAGGIGLERVHLVARDDQVEPAQQAEAVEHVGRDLPGVVRPQRDGEAGSACALDGVAGPWLERRAVQRSPLVIERERATADGIVPVARRALERFVQEFPKDSRLADAVLLLGRARLAVGDNEAALEAFKRAQTFQPPPGRPLEVKFWEGEALFRLRRFADARAAYESVLKADATSPLAPEAQYGLAWTELEQKHAEAAKAFREFIDTWPTHALAPSATFYLARALVEQRRFNEAVPLLQGFVAKNSSHKLAPDARYLLGMAKVNGGDPRAGVADLRAFIEAAPQHPDVPAARAVINETLGRHGDRQEMQDTYAALMAQSPATAEALNDAAGIAGRLARPKDQEVAWKKLRAEFPDHPLAHRAALDLANAAFKRKDYKDAATQAQAATKSEEDGVRSEALLLSGESELKLKRFPIAAKAFEAAAEMKSADAAVRYRALAGLGLAREEQ